MIVTHIFYLRRIRLLLIRVIRFHRSDVRCSRKDDAVISYSKQSDVINRHCPAQCQHLLPSGSLSPVNSPRDIALLSFSSLSSISSHFSLLSLSSLLLSLSHASCLFPLSLLYYLFDLSPLSSILSLFSVIYLTYI